MGNNNTKLTVRPPIVVVLGHVDHGKTTLLDTIRKTSVATKEAGGITQTVGASEITFTDSAGQSKSICFIDTPGHAAFGKMRSRGARVADIAVLVVAQDDGLKPQTKEALEIIGTAKIPFVLAATKADVAGVNIEKVLGELEKEQVFFEGRGGDTPFVSVSAKTGLGINELLETISLMADVLELKGDVWGELEGVVIESGKDKMGPYAAVIVRNGSIKVGQTIYAERLECRIRALFESQGKSVKEIFSGKAAKVYGFTDVPPVGSKIGINIGEAKVTTPQTLKGAFASRKLAKDEIPVIIKADSAGALEAIKASLPSKVVVVGSGVGEVKSSDVLAAKTGNARIYTFGSKVPADVAKLAETEKIKIGSFNIIYELLESIEELLKKGLVEVVGKAEVLASFPFDNKKVAGCKVLSGRISRGDKLVVMRLEKEVGKARALNIRKQKSEVNSVGAMEEFGVILEPQLNFEVGDILASVK